MIGLALVVFVTVFANGLRASIEDLIDRTLAGNIAVLHDDGFSPIPAAIGPAVAKVPGVAAVSSFRDTQAKIKGVDGKLNTHAIEPSTVGARSTTSTGRTAPTRRCASLGDDGVLLEEDDGRPRASSRSATASRSSGPSGNVSAHRARHLQGRRAARRLHHDRPRRSTASSTRSASRACSSRPTRARACPTVQKRVTQALAGFPEARARSQDELKKENADQVNQLLGLFYALLAMSVIISAFGIVNTLTLSIFERTRELGLLRAVGMTRRDVRRMVRYESVITALFGALLGLVLGLFFAFVVIQALESEGITFSVPIGQIVSLMVFAIVVGVVAAIFPARRASRLDVLRAIAYE